MNRTSQKWVFCAILCYIIYGLFFCIETFINETCTSTYSLSGFNFMITELISSSSKVVCLLSFSGDLECLSNILPQQGSYIFGSLTPCDYQTWCSVSFSGVMWRVPLPRKWNTRSLKPWHQLPWTPLHRSRKEHSIELMSVVWLMGLLLITCLKVSKILYYLCMPCPWKLPILISVNFLNCWFLAELPCMMYSFIMYT